MNTSFSTDRMARKAGAFAAAFATLAWFQATARADDPSLLGYWRFDETGGTAAVDSSDHGNNGTASGTTFVAGQLNGAYNFNSGTALVNADSGTTLDNPAGLTIAAWIKPTGFGGGGGFGRIVDKTGYRLAFSNNSLDFVVLHTANLQRRSVSNVITLNAWQHVAVTWDGSATATNVHIYINGTEVGSYSTTTNASGTRVSDAATNMVMGNDPTLIRAFDGRVDDVRVFNRVLSLAEIQALP